MRFPPDFLWGTATAALQIEGASREDGREPSWWDDFCRDHPQRIHQRATPERACDHYHRYREDLDWIQKLGHNAYRFSISWPRGKAGLDFYDRLVDGLCQRGIAPLATLYHWDLPSRLGSWEDPRVVEAFLEFVEACARRLGDRVSHWMTFNEPAWSLMNGYVTGLHPPGLQDLQRGFQAAHHHLQAHHRALGVLRGQGVGGKLGIALNLSPVRCAGSTAHDRRAAGWADDYLNGWFLEAVVKGRYPDRARRLLERTLGFGEVLQDTQPLDFLGVNYYYPKWVAHCLEPTRFHLNTSGDPGEKCHFSLQGRLRFCPPPTQEARRTDWDWEIDPAGLTDLLLGLARDYPGLPLMVTENGMGRREDWGDFEDLPRIEFLSQHIQAVEKAIQSGAPVQGYLVWSLMDNFSWLNGYHKRYGLLAVHPETLERHPRASAHWLRQFIEGLG